MTGTTYQIALEISCSIMTIIYGHLSEPIIRRNFCNYHFTFSPFIYHNIFVILCALYLVVSFVSQSFIYLNSVQLMSIMDHFGYTTRPLVEYNLEFYTYRASFLGWLGHMSKRRRLAITLDPASSEPSRFKNKRIQASGDMMRGESESEVPKSVSSSSKPSSSVTKSSLQPHPFSPQAPSKAARRAEREREREADSDEEYKPPTKVTKAKSKRSSPRSKAG